MNWHVVISCCFQHNKIKEDTFWNDYTISSTQWGRDVLKFLQELIISIYTATLTWCFWNCCFFLVPLIWEGKAETLGWVGQFNTQGRAGERTSKVKEIFPFSHVKNTDESRIIENNWETEKNWDANLKFYG